MNDTLEIGTRVLVESGVLGTVTAIVTPRGADPPMYEVTHDDESRSPKLGRYTGRWMTVVRDGDMLAASRMSDEINRLRRNNGELRLRIEELESAIKWAKHFILSSNSVAMTGLYEGWFERGVNGEVEGAVCDFVIAGLVERHPVRRRAFRWLGEFAETRREVET